jgi:uncharacterized protein (DUF433 family)
VPDHGPVLQGVVHGRVIELERELGVPDGETVTVTVQYAKIRPPEEFPEDLPRAELWADRLVLDPSVLPGERIVKGTKLAAEPLVAEIERGASNQAVLQAHPELTPEDVEALRVFARVPAWIRRTAGAWAEDAQELDEYLEWTRQQRKSGHRGIEE